MSDLQTIAQAIQVRREQHLHSRAASTAHLEQDDLASLLHRPKCQHGDLQRLLHRRAGSPVFGTSELHHIEDRGSDMAEQ